MAFTPENAVNEIAQSLATDASMVVIDKGSISNAVAGRIYSLWRATGQPAQGGIPAAAAVCTNATVGAMVFTRPGGKTQSALARADIASGNATTTIRFVDRLKHMGGLSGTVTTAQGALDLTGISAARIGPTDFRELQWQLEWYTDTGSTAVTMTVNVTYNDDTTGNVTVSAVATSRAAGTYPILPAVAGRFIKAVTGVTLSATTGTAGSFGITVKRYLGSTVAHVGNMSAVADWAQLGLGPVQSDSCVTMEMLCVTTSTGTLRGHLAIAHG